MTAVNSRREQVRPWFDEDWPPEHTAQVLGWPVRDVQRHYDALLDEHGGKSEDYHLATPQLPDPNRSKKVIGAMFDSVSSVRQARVLREREPRVLQPCGTVAAAKRHKNAGEELCEPCKEAKREEAREIYRKRRARDNKVVVPRPTRPDVLPEHGTYNMYVAHKRRKEDACPPCLEAKRVYSLNQAAAAAANEERTS